jgi:hypothetical protein
MNSAFRKAGVVAALAVVVTAVLHQGNAEPPAGDTWRLVWGDEFEGTTIDTKKWRWYPFGSDAEGTAIAQRREAWYSREDGSWAGDLHGTTHLLPDHWLIDYCRLYKRSDDAVHAALPARTAGAAQDIRVIAHGGITEIHYALSAARQVSITMHDMRGRNAVAPFNAFQQSGPHVLRLIRPVGGRKCLPAGSYVWTVTVGDTRCAIPVVIDASGANRGIH